MKELRNALKEAAVDYLFLLEKKYPQKSILKLVGDKYQLTGQERSMLFRGVHPLSLCRLRKEKRIINPVNDEHYFIDGYNVIRTIGSYLLGKPLFMSMDGFLRDASEMHKATLQEKILHQAISLIIGYLVRIKVENIKIYLDQPVSKSGELALLLNSTLFNSGLTGKAITAYSPDHHLKQIQKGIVCTSDSAIIDLCKVKLFDLAYAVLELNFKPDLINLQNEDISL